MMQGGYGAAAKEETEWTFKRYILEKTEEFEHEPMADLYRVNLLGQMLDRCDELKRKGLTAQAAVQRTLDDFADIPRRMQREGFEANAESNRWAQLTEEEAADYVKQSSAYTHRIALGSALCSACVGPMMALMSLAEYSWSSTLEEIASIVGLIMMFGMIGMGVYCLTTAKKPKNKDKIRERRFSLSARLRKKLMMLKEAAEEKSRRRRGRGIALLATCVVPIFIGALLDQMWYLSQNPFSILGVAAMFLMIGLGVYEVVSAPSEKKPLNELLKDE